VLYVGGGVTKAGAEAALRELAEAAGAPVTTTLMARGAFPDSHPLALGMPGMHGNYAAVAALQEADLLVALGARFDDRVTGNLATFAPKAKIVHADIDPAEIGKNRTADVPIVGDVKLVVEELAGPTRRPWPPTGPATPRPGSGPAPSGSSASRSATTSTTAARSSPSTWSSGCRP
jgi:acetolactate synthase-1/2/3 large subunit